MADPMGLVGEGDPLTSVEAHVSVIRELLSMVTVSDGLPRNHILDQSMDQIQQRMRYCSVTFLDENFVDNLYRGYSPEQIPKWDTAETSLKIIQMFFKKTQVDDKDLRQSMSEEFGEDSAERLKFDAIKKLLKSHGNYHIKTILYEYLALGSTIADFLVDKQRLWLLALNHYDAWNTSRATFQDLDEDTPIETVEEKYTEVNGLMKFAVDAIGAFLKRNLKKVKHLQSRDILLSYNYRELLAEEDSLQDIMDREQNMGIYRLKSNLSAKEFFQDIRISNRNDRELLETFRTRARNAAQETRTPRAENTDANTGETGNNGRESRSDNSTPTSRLNGSNGNQHNDRREQQNNERREKIKRSIERSGFHDIMEVDELISQYPRMVFQTKNMKEK